MEDHRRLNRSAAALALPLVLLLADSATVTPVEKLLQGAEIIAAFDGQTVEGAYKDGLAFRETYFTGGKIDYWDPRAASGGQWSVVNDLFCTFYTAMSGGCFRIVQVSANCFDFYAAADSEREAMEDGKRSDYTARGAVKGKASTCPDELQA
jgi:hypothetical protein